MKLITLPSVSVWLLKEADAKMGLFVQGIFQRKFLWRIKGRKCSEETSCLLQVSHLWKDSQESWRLTRWYKPDLYTWGVWAPDNKALPMDFCTCEFTVTTGQRSTRVMPKWITCSTCFLTCPNCIVAALIPADWSPAERVIIPWVHEIKSTLYTPSE